MEPELVGNYQLLERIGAGTMGRVYLARHNRIGRQVALKVLRPEHSHNPQLVHRFFQEAQAVNQINHEHIVEIFDFIEEETEGNKRAAIVMELLAGSSLKSELKTGPLSIARAARILRQVCSALEAAHARGIVHRDIKPDNIFLIRRSGTADFVKVLDFGVAKLIRPISDITAPGTLEGAIIGTPAYMPPEQAAGKPIDWRADIYALGALAHEMISGAPPFGGDNLGVLLMQILNDPPPELPEWSVSGEPVPESLRALLGQCLAKDPAQRLQSMAELAEALQPYEISDTLVVHRRSRHWAWMSAGAAVAIALGVAVSILLEETLQPAPAAARPAPAKPPAPAPAPPAQVATPPSPPVAPLATLSVQSHPRGARVVRTDTGEELGVAPFDRRLPPSTEVVRLRAELSGYESVERDVLLEKDRDEEFTLVPKKPSEERRPAPARKTEMTRDGVLNPYAN
jgi:hypothetical protein